MLFKAEVTHDSRGCAAFCANDPSNLVVRHERAEHGDNPAIHFTMEKDILCFEMEAAGLMNNCPCLVICGTFNYADWHKNKEWQGYAAMAAAAYAKDPICRILPSRIEDEKRIGDNLSNGWSRAVKSMAHFS